MRYSARLKRSFIIGAIVVVALTLATGFYLRSATLLQSSVSPLAADSAASHTQNLPARLKIPSINVNSAIEYVGVAQNGTMDLPKSPERAGWFAPGPRPGEVGSAVIAGHYGWKDGIPAVFDTLSALQKGDKIYIEDGKGSVVTFVVREMHSYDPAADATVIFTSTDGKSHLNLITCEGVWNKVQQSYAERLVVFADRVE